MSPPQLAADTPILYVFEPQTVGGLIFFGHEADKVVHHGRKALVGKVLHLHKPLQGQARLHRHLGTLGESYIVGIVLYFLKESCGFKILGDGLAHIETIHANIHAGHFGHGSVLVEDVDGFKRVVLAEHIVVLIVGGSHLEAACAKLNVDIAVFDNGYGTVHERHHNLAAFEPSILGVFRIDTHRGITHDGFRASSGHECVMASFGIGMHHRTLGGIKLRGLLGKIVTQIVKLTLLLDEEHLVVADGGTVLRIPVDHTQIAVYQSLVKKVDKHFLHTRAPFLVHSERRAIPVARSAELA